LKITGYKYYGNTNFKTNDTNVDECNLLQNDYVGNKITHCLYKNHHKQNECLLPGLENLTSIQLFWVKTVQNDCILDRKEPWTEQRDLQQELHKKDFMC
jgi:hypothetical protein